MFNVLRSLELDSDFERREYRLGDTVQVMVSLKARTNIMGAQARVELVCHERFHEIHTVMVPASRPVVPARFGGPQLPQVRIPKRVTEEFKSTSIHSQEVFLNDFSLARGTSETFQVALHIEPHLPPYTDRGGTVRWRLAVSLEQDNGTVISKEKRILVGW